MVHKVLLLNLLQNTVRRELDSILLTLLKRFNKDIKNLVYIVHLSENTAICTNTLWVICPQWQVEKKCISLNPVTLGQGQTLNGLSLNPVTLGQGQTFNGLPRIKIWPPFTPLYLCLQLSVIDLAVLSVICSFAGFSRQILSRIVRDLLQTHKGSSYP